MVGRKEQVKRRKGREGGEGGARKGTLNNHGAFRKVFTIPSICTRERKFQQEGLWVSERD